MNIYIFIIIKNTIFYNLYFSNIFEYFFKNLFIKYKNKKNFLTNIKMRKNI